MDWFLYDNGLHHERVKYKMKRLQISKKLVYEKFYVHKIATVILSKIVLTEKRKQTCKPNKRDLNHD